MAFIRKKSIEIKSNKVEIGPPRLTVYEIARIIGARATQIAFGAPILISLAEVTLTEINEIDIAKLELKLGVLPITIQRWLPDGRYQNIPIQWLKFEENI
ncbi:MAG: DNA-directed RNA polymerase subunit K [Candidatus Njordarchaeales archaeon]